MFLTISHKTVYHYDSPASYGLQQLRMTPKARLGQKIHEWKIDLVGAEKQVSFDDQNNNHVWLTRIDPDVEQVEITCSGVVETEDRVGIIGMHGGFAPLWLFQRQTALTQPGPAIRQLVKSVGKVLPDPLAAMHRLSALIADQVTYKIGVTMGETTAEQAVLAGAGVCQDHTHIMVSAARLLGFPARYVSGYLMMNDRIEQDAGHAWAEIYLETLGWVGFDVSNAISPDARYVRVATGLDYVQAAPITGLLMGGNTQNESHNRMVVTIMVEQGTQQ